MSVGELLDDQRAAGRVIGLDSRTIDDVIEAQRTRIINLGDVLINTDEGTSRSITAWRGHSGPDSSMYKGGSRITDRQPFQDAQELPVEMTVKANIAGLTDIDGTPIGGGKLIMEADPLSLSHEEKRRLFAAVAFKMFEKGILGYDKSVPAGDMGTNHTDFMDAYALAAHNLQPHDPYWQATITGKSERYGGLEFRPHATGYGVYRAVEYARHQRDLGGTVDVTISGAGNVGGWAGYYLTHHESDGRRPYRIVGYSDAVSTLHINGRTPDSTGIVVDRYIAEKIFDNPDFHHDPDFKQFHGDKMLALAVELAKRQPGLEFSYVSNNTRIFDVPSDVFIPASVGGLIHEANITKLAGRIVVEGANGPTTKAAYERGLTQGTDFMVDTEANAGGVDMSMVEVNGNVRSIRDGTPMPTFTQAEELARKRSDARYARVEKMRLSLGTSNRRLAANALAMSSLALQLGSQIDHSLADILRAA